MGTTYKIYKQKETELRVCEMSNKLQLDIATTNYEEAPIDLTEEMTPVEMMKIFLEGIKVCSYWMSKEEFDRTLINNFKEYSF